MKTLSLWASRHTRLASLLIILGEVINGFNGVLLGATLLGDWPPAGLYIAMTALIINAFCLYYYASQPAVANGYWSMRRALFAAFLSNFLLFNLLGGIWSHQGQTRHSSVSALGNHHSAVVRETAVASDSLPETRHTVSVTKTSASDRQVGRRLTYVLLGLLGIAVMFTVAGLACNILCSGYGFAALLVFYLGLGGLAGTVYFISRAGTNPLNRRDMTPAERKRDSRRFWLSWLILIGGFSLLLLVTSSR